MDGSDLQLNFSDFCFDHFQHNDTAKDDQYTTPLGSKDISPTDNESDSIEVVKTPLPLQESTVSSASTNNTDICVLDSYLTNEDIQFLPNGEDEVENHEGDDECVASEEGDDVFLRDLAVLDKLDDFTVLQKPTNTRDLYNCDESTEVLLLIDSEYQEKRKPTYSGTESDVEILISEEIMESEWSAGNVLDENFKEVSMCRAKTNVSKLNMYSELGDSLPSCIQNSCEASYCKTRSSTDFAALGEDLVDSCKANDKYHNFSRTQLLQLIQKQELCIKALEATVENYRKAQERLFEHVDALRIELSEIRITPSQIIEQSESN